MWDILRDLLVADIFVKIIRLGRYSVVVIFFCCVYFVAPAQKGQKGVNAVNEIEASSRGTAGDRLNLGSNESQYKILNPHMPQDRGFSRILVQDGDKN